MKIGKGHAVHEEGEEGLHRHITKVIIPPLTDAVIGIMEHSHLF